LQKKQDYLEDLKSQMAVNEGKRSEAKKQLMDETVVQDTDRKGYQVPILPDTIFPILHIFVRFFRRYV
jgi:hypothetical protein